MKGLTHSLCAAAFAVACVLAPPAFAAGPVDLNQASVAELVTLKGIGPVYAERIVDYRAEHGRFDSVDQLTEVRGIGAKTVAAIEEQIRLGN